MEEDIERLEKLSIDDVKSLHGEFLNGQHGEIAVVGDFDPDATLAKLNEVFAGWKTEQPLRTNQRACQSQCWWRAN